jgi:hypothetical protein
VQKHSYPAITTTNNINFAVDDENIEQKPSSSTSWYSRMSAEKKKEYLLKQRIARQQKKATTLHLPDQGKQIYESLFNYWNDTYSSRSIMFRDT